MVRILNTISVLSLVLAALAVVLCVRNWDRTNSGVDSAAMISAIDRFKQMAEGKVDQVQPQMPPLVQQAQALASYLNPSRAQQTLTYPAAQVSSPVTQVQVKPASSSLKFELHGISYYRSRPEDSMALVYESGSGRQWVRQGTQLGRVIIEKITSTTIVCRDGERIQEVALASNQVLTKYAEDRSEKIPTEPLLSPDFGKPSPPPVRGIRQMPAGYAAARMGLQLGNVDTPGDRPAESK